jgi:hypothetical protein
MVLYGNAHYQLTMNLKARSPLTINEISCAVCCFSCVKIEGCVSFWIRFQWKINGNLPEGCCKIIFENVKQVFPYYIDCKSNTCISSEIVRINFLDQKFQVGLCTFRIQILTSRFQSHGNAWFCMWEFRQRSEMKTRLFMLLDCVLLDHHPRLNYCKVAISLWLSILKKYFSCKQDLVM